MANPVPPPERRRWRRFFRFRLSTVLWVFVVVSIALGWFGVRWYRHLEELWSIDAIQAAGGTVVTREDGTARRVWLGGASLDDEGLNEMAPHLDHLATLEELDIVEAPVTDDGLRLLERMRQIKLLYVHQTQASEAGLMRLKQALPNVELRQEKPDPVATKLARRVVYPHAVVASAFSPDGQWYVTGSGDGTLRWWSGEPDESVETVQAHDNWLFAAVFSPDGQMLATGGGDNRIRLWNAESRSLIGELIGHDNDVHALAFDPSGQVLYSAGDDALVRVWNVADRRQIDVLGGHTGAIPSLALSPDGRLLATGSRDDTIRLWSVAETDRKLLHILTGHVADVAAVAFSPDGRSLASAGYDRRVRIWDASNGEEQFALAGHEDWVFAIGFLPGGNRLASGAGDGTVRVWDLATRQQVAKYRGQHDVSTIRISPDGRSLATTAADGTIFLRDSASGTLRFVLRTRFGDRGLALRRISFPAP